MRRANAILCDTPDWPGCQLVAAFSWVCNVEGREVTLCRNCDKMWKDHARTNSSLGVRCPNCAKSAPPEALPRPEGYTDLLGEYMRIAVDRAMHRAGVLIDQRQAVIKLLDTDMSIWAEAEQRGQAQHASD